MRIYRSPAILVLTASLSLAAANLETTLVTIESAESFELTVPAGKLTLIIPKAGLAADNLKAGGATENPRYFELSDRARGLVISGWFEPASAFHGMNDFWKQEFTAMKANGLIPTAPPDSVEAGDWVAAAYELKLPSKVQGVVNTHIRAELIKSGTWIDVHISVTSRDSVETARGVALDFLRSLTLKVKD